MINTVETQNKVFQIVTLRGYKLQVSGCKNLSNYCIHIDDTLGPVQIKLLRESSFRLDIPILKLL